DLIVKHPFYLPNQISISGETPLISACHSNAEDSAVIVNTIIHNTYKLNVKDIANGDTALHIITAKDNVTILFCLLLKCASANIANYKGELPIHIAAFHGFNQCLEILLRHTDDINSATH
ncbi:MAG: ankyrin repeat domain-containing protein, partial [Pseudomonadota bacterium]